MVVFIKKHFFQIATIGIILLALVLRFYNYPDRWGLAYDQAHDALMARYAISHFQFPLLGPFSSAGAFQTGGEWYWIVMLGTAFFPWSLLSPWVFITLIYVFFVYLIMRVGEQFAGKTFALIVGLLSAVSTAQISQATNLTNQSPQALFALLAIWCGMLYVKKQKLKYVFLLGLFIGIASSIHLSGVALIFLPLSLLIVYRKITLKGIGLFLLGIFLPWLPVFFVDMQHNFLNTRHMIQYYLHDQYTVSLEVLGRRWLTYLGVFWPKEWANIIGGPAFLGYVEIVSLACLFIFRKFLKKEIVVLLLSVGCMILLLRYTHTPLFASYLVFMHPFILLLTAWVVYLIFKKQKIVGVAFLLVIVIGSLYQDIIFIRGSTNYSAVVGEDMVNVLLKKYPNQTFAVYTFKEKWKDKNYILALYLTKANKIEPNGLKIGTVIATQAGEFKQQRLYGEKKGYQILDLSKIADDDLLRKGWRPVDGKIVYDDTENWFDKKK